MRRPLPSGRSSQTYVGRIVVELALSLVEPERRHIITSCHPVIMLFCHQVQMSLCHHIFMIISRGPLVVFVMDVGQSPLLWRSLHLRDESILVLRNTIDPFHLLWKSVLLSSLSVGSMIKKTKDWGKVVYLVTSSWKKTIEHVHRVVTRTLQNKPEIEKHWKK